MTNEVLAAALSLASEAAALTNHVTWAELMGKAALAIEELQKDIERLKDFEAFWQHEAEEALKKFQVAIRSKPQWIPVTERLPDKGGTYLIACGNGLITTDEFMVWPDRVKTYYNWDDYGGGIKYWMEIPKPPNEFFESLKCGLEQAINGETREITIEVEE